MKISEARLYLEHTSIDDFNLEEHQRQNRYEAIQVLLNTIDKAVEYVDVITNKSIYESGYGKGTAITICKEHLLDILNGRSDE